MICEGVRILKEHLLLLLISFIGLLIRYTGLDFISIDMKVSLLPWYHVIKDGGGLTALNKQVGDYGLLYQTIISLFTYIDINPVYLYKLLSIFFDYLLALSIAYYIVNSGLKTVFGDCKKENVFLLCYSSVLLLPTVVMNSALWGQCDSIYTFFLLWSIWFLYKETYLSSFFMLGCALAFKLQSVFIIPLFLWYIYNKRCSAVNSIITFVTFWLSGLIAYFYGRDSLDGIWIYFSQVGKYQKMWMNVPSFWRFWKLDYATWHLFAICLTFVILGIGFYIIVKNRIQIASFEQLFVAAAFIEWTCILFLPAMHERYTYVLDLILLMLALINKRYIKYAFLAILLSILTYKTFLFSGKGVRSWYVVFYLFSYLHFLYSSYRLLYNNTNDHINFERT